MAEELLAVRSRLASDEAVYTVLRAADQLRQAYPAPGRAVWPGATTRPICWAAASLQEGLTHVPAQDDGPANEQPGRAAGGLKVSCMWMPPGWPGFASSA